MEVKIAISTVIQRGSTAFVYNEKNQTVSTESVCRKSIDRNLSQYNIDNFNKKNYLYIQ